MNRNFKQRAYHHDYHRAGIYMVTMVVSGRAPILGSLVCGDRPKIIPSDLGWRIKLQESKKMHGVHRNVEVWKFCLMPDHVHMIIRVKTDFPQGMHLGDVIRGFKTGCNRLYWELGGRKGQGLFETGYNDRLLKYYEHLKVWKNYLDDNPRRLYIKRQHPEFFRSIHDVQILDRSCQIIGNRFLLDNPDKEAVIVRSHFSEEKFKECMEGWLACCERGGVLVGFWISEREKLVMKEAMEQGFPVIRIRDEGFGDYYKPAGSAFDACAAGQLLQISALPHNSPRPVFSRAFCWEMNRFAERIAATPSLTFS